MNDGTAFQSGSSHRTVDFTANELAEIAAALKAAYQVAEPDSEFRLTLHNRLVEEAALRAVPQQTLEHSLVRRAVVGAAAVSALSVAGLALMFLRRPRPASLLSRVGLHAASGG